MALLSAGTRPPREAVNRTAGGGAAADRRRRRRRATSVVLALALMTATLFVLNLMIGTHLLPATDVVRSVLGLSGEAGVDFVVRDLRLPRALAAVMVGMALGAAGTIFQQLLSNLLAAPDIIGISSGASLAAVAGIVLFQLGGYGVPIVAAAGALGSAALIYVIAWRNGITGYRLILVGIGVSQFLLAIITYLVARADIHDAREAMRWLVGSVGQSGTNERWALAVGLLVLLPAALLLNRPLRTLELGDDAAAGLGVRVEPARLGLLATSVLLVALATAVAGPIAFVALVAGPVARRLLAPATGGVAAPALVGGCAVLLADLISQHLLPDPLPTGVVTGAIGAPYLIWLLATFHREGRAG